MPKTDKNKSVDTNKDEGIKSLKQKINKDDGRPDVDKLFNSNVLYLSNNSVITGILIGKEHMWQYIINLPANIDEFIRTGSWPMKIVNVLLIANQENQLKHTLSNYEPERAKKFIKNNLKKVQSAYKTKNKRDLLKKFLYDELGARLDDIKSSRVTINKYTNSIKVLRHIPLIEQNNDKLYKARKQIYNGNADGSIKEINIGKFKDVMPQLCKKIVAERAEIDNI